MLASMGVGAFADGARRELVVTRASARRRAPVHQPPHGRVPPEQGLRQARDQLAPVQLGAVPPW
jgi:hypothetical protein